jgi:hypothetical protein
MSTLAECNYKIGIECEVGAGEKGVLGVLSYPIFAGQAQYQEEELKCRRLHRGEMAKVW